MSARMWKVMLRGSSPRVRGKGDVGRDGVGAVGIIPAGAGKSPWCRWRLQRRLDHPRGCGEKPLALARSAAAAGSSPRVRGKARCRQGLRPGRGIIPAGAGKRMMCSISVSFRGDHPRGCGEKWTTARPTPAPAGSSPRVRGKVGGVAVEVGADGIIPAGAGKSHPPRRRRHADRDHPRGCGEKGSSILASVSRVGSSPRVRGKALRARGQRGGAGIIPAGAGKRLARPELRVDGRDHPRGCGEKSVAKPEMAWVSGSSPRVRGKVWRRDRSTPRTGIIPAGAGKRVGWSRRWSR